MNDSEGREGGRGRLGLPLMLAASLALAGCLTIGGKFDDSRVQAILVGKTTQAEVENAFGRPYRTGLEDGDTTWTYLDYHLSLFGAQRTVDLYIRYNADGTVKSYAFNKNAPRN